MWNLKCGTNEPVYETDSQTQRTDLWLPWGRLYVGDALGVWGWQIQITTYRMDKQGPPLYSTGNYIQYSGINYNGKEYKKKYIYVYN